MGARRRTIVMVTSSYPRFAGDAVATFMEPIARGIAARSDAVHLVAPWHSHWARGRSDGNLSFHLYHYAPAERWEVFGYAGSMRADVRLRASAIAVAPMAVAAGIWRTRRVVSQKAPALVHAHWVIPGGVQAAAAAGRVPLVISLHGSDVFVAERHALARLAAKRAFRRASWVTACSPDLQRRAIALGANADRTSLIPYGVDSERFKPDRDARERWRRKLGLDPDVQLVLAFGRLVEKKGFEYLVEAFVELVKTRPGGRAVHLVIAGEGDLAPVLRGRAEAAGLNHLVHLPGVVSHDDMPGLVAASDVAVVPSIRDEAGNVDGLPNTVLEIMASATPLVATPAGGIASVAADRATARIVPEKDASALATAIVALLDDPVGAGEMGRRAREVVCCDYSWARVADRFEEVYERVLAQAQDDR